MKVICTKTNFRGYEIFRMKNLDNYYSLSRT